MLTNKKYFKKIALYGIMLMNQFQKNIPESYDIDSVHCDRQRMEATQLLLLIVTQPKTGQ